MPSGGCPSRDRSHGVGSTITGLAPERQASQGTSTSLEPPWPRYPRSASTACVPSRQHARGDARRLDLPRVLRAQPRVAPPVPQPGVSTSWWAACGLGRQAAGPKGQWQSRRAAVAVAVVVYMRCVELFPARLDRSQGQGQGQHVGFAHEVVLRAGGGECLSSNSGASHPEADSRAYVARFFGRVDLGEPGPFAGACCW